MGVFLADERNHRQARDAGGRGAAILPWAEKWLSAERLAPYLEASSGDVEGALELYRWNVAFGQFLMRGICYFEIALRNAYNDVMEVRWDGAEQWLLDDASPVRRPVARRSGRCTHRIVTACFDADGNRVEPEGVCPVYDTGSTWPTFALIRPAVDNTRVDMSPYGQSVFADAVDAIQAVDLCYDAMMGEIDNGKMRVFLSDVMFDVEKGVDGRRVPIPFGRGDCTVFRVIGERAHPGAHKLDPPPSSASG